MMNEKGFVVVSGLPASGKTTIGRWLAEALGWPILDKDDFLEAEFDKFSAIDMARRQQLSRKSDAIFEQRAKGQSSGVLVSFWRPSDQLVSYGTATEWISELQSPVVELHCRCDPAVAQKRFSSRTRHPGHNDALRLDGLARQFDELAPLGPLGIWPCVTIETTDLRDIDTVGERATEEVRRLLYSFATKG